MTQTSTPAILIGQVQLFVADLERSVNFYTRVIGLKLLSREGGQAVMGAGSRPLLRLVERPGAQPAPRTTGLYHFAILLPSRRSLAEFLVHLANEDIEVEGGADHGVSEAIYMQDPDRNGIEIYRDRRRGEWPRDDLKRLQMVTEELDVDDLVMELKNGIEPWNGLPPETIVGHIHLKVAGLPESEKFYTQALGFEVTQRMPGALFLSTGGYHHHIGMNTWSGVNLPPLPENAAGLGWFEVLLPDAAAMDALKARLEAAGVSAEPAGGGLLVRDPSQNAILFKIL